MPIAYQKIIRRSDLKANPNTYYVFGDNIVRWGLGGQAKEMRGEPNAIGIPTKYSPQAFAKDIDLWLYAKYIEIACTEIFAHLSWGRTVVFPEDGIGTGLAELETRAPKVWGYLNRRLEVLKFLDENDPENVQSED